MEAERSLVNRMIRAARLDVDLYEEVEADTTANRQAFASVLIASLASGLGTGIAGFRVEGGMWLLWGLLIGLAASIGGWLAWSMITYWLGTTVFRGPETSATPGELMRTIGFSNSPRVLTFFYFIPIVGGLIALGASIWALVAGVIAVRQALDFGTWRAIGTCVVGWLVYMLIFFLVSILAIGGSALF